MAAHPSAVAHIHPPTPCAAVAPAAAGFMTAATYAQQMSAAPPKPPRPAKAAKPLTQSNTLWTAVQKKAKGQGQG